MYFQVSVLILHILSTQVSDTGPVVLWVIFQTGTIRGTLLAVEHMRRDKGGEGGIIINVASAGGKVDDSIFFCVKVNVDVINIVDSTV